MGPAGAGCGEVPHGNSVCSELLGLDRLVPGEKDKSPGLSRKEGACNPPPLEYHWLVPCLMLCWEAAGIRVSQPWFLFS